MGSGQSPPSAGMPGPMWGAELWPYRGDVEQCPELQHRRVHLCRRWQCLGATSTQRKATVPAGRDGHFRTCHPSETLLAPWAPHLPRRRGEGHSQGLRLPRGGLCPRIAWLCPTPPGSCCLPCPSARDPSPWPGSPLLVHPLLVPQPERKGRERGETPPRRRHSHSWPPAALLYPVVPALPPDLAGFGPQCPSLLPPQWQLVPKSCPVIPAVSPGCPP